MLVDDPYCCREMKCNSTCETRLGDVFHPDVEQGLPAYFDLIVWNCLQPSYLVKAAGHLGAAAGHSGAAAEAGEIEKDQKHDWIVLQSGGVFHPLVVETLGLWSPSSLEVLKVIASRTSFITICLLVSQYVICTSNFLSNCGF